METTILNSGQQPATLTEAEKSLLLNQARFAEAEREALKGKTPEQMIEFYLDYWQSKDEELGKKYPENPQGKTIKDCYQYILSEVRKNANGSNAAMLYHETVFEIARNYFIDDSIKKHEKVTPAKTFTTDTKIKNMSEEERSKREKEWEEERQKRAKTWLENNAKKRDKWQKEHDQKVAVWRSDMFEDHSQEPDWVKEKNPYGEDNNPILQEKNPYILKNKDNTEPNKTEEIEEEINTEAEEKLEDIENEENDEPEMF